MVNTKKNISLNYEDDSWIQNGYTLRRVIGVLGMSLPILLYSFLRIFEGHTNVLPSISHYYYTRADGIFLIIVGVMAMFLIIYKGKAPIDFWLSLAAGISAILLLLFPTSALISVYPNSDIPFSNTVLSSNSIRENFHFICAGIFLLSLSYMSIFIFTKSNKPKAQRGRMKNLRNNIYIICGVLMILALIVIALKPFGINNITFWMESIAIVLFGFSWLVKGDALFGDKHLA